MGIQYRKRVSLGHGLRVNVSRSGLSLSQRAGRATVNTRGRGAFRFGGGWFWRGKI